MIIWEDLKLTKPAKLVFSDRTVGVVRLQKQRAPLEPSHREFALITIEGDGQLELNDCVDTSPNYEEPWILVVRGEPTDQILLFGGEVIYIVSSKGQVVKEMRIFRKRRNDKFWRTEVVRLDENSILIVYEVGALVVESSLNVRWHVEKALIDFFDHREASELVFLRDHEVPFTIDIATGEGVPAIVTGQ